MKISTFFNVFQRFMLFFLTSQRAPQALSDPFGLEREPKNKRRAVPPEAAEAAVAAVANRKSLALPYYPMVKNW
jgi:hypothetical protein